MLEMVGVCRASEKGKERCSNSVGRGYYLQVCAAYPNPRLIRKVSNLVHPGNNIHDTFPTRTWPDTALSNLQAITVGSKFNIMNTQFDPHHCN
jgi:hypothetical protein